MITKQTLLGALSRFLYNADKRFAKKGEGPDKKVLLGIAPTAVMRHEIIYVDHPLMDEEGAEVVLLHYAKKNGKYRGPQKNKIYKRGYCVCSGKTGRGETPIFIFQKETVKNALTRFLNEAINKGPTYLDSHFGIALRIPNPEWTRGETKHKNAIYKGVPESLWSAVLPISVADPSGVSIGFGLI